jgi:hypothetical protein
LRDVLEVAMIHEKPKSLMDWIPVCIENKWDSEVRT